MAGISSAVRGFAGRASGSASARIASSGRANAMKARAVAGQRVATGLSPYRSAQMGLGSLGRRGSADMSVATSVSRSSTMGRTAQSRMVRRGRNRMRGAVMGGLGVGAMMNNTGNPTQMSGRSSGSRSRGVYGY